MPCLLRWMIDDGDAIRILVAQDSDEGMLIIDTVDEEDE